MSSFRKTSCDLQNESLIDQTDLNNGDVVECKLK